MKGGSEWKAGEEETKYGYRKGGGKSDRIYRFVWIKGGMTRKTGRMVGAGWKVKGVNMEPWKQKWNGRKSEKLQRSTSHAIERRRKKIVIDEWRISERGVSKKGRINGIHSDLNWIKSDTWCVTPGTHSSIMSRVKLLNTCVNTTRIKKKMHLSVRW